MEENSLVSAIAKASQIGFPILFITEANVKNVNKTRKTIIVTHKDSEIEDVRWLSPVLPKKGAKCLLVFRDNLETRPTAIEFEEIDEFKTTIGNFTELEISDTSGVKIKHKNTNIDIAPNGNLTIKNAGLELEMNALTNKWTLKGNLEIGTSGLEKAVLGETLKTKLEELIQAITSLTVTCGAPGTPSSPPLNASQFQQIKNTLGDILTNKVKLS